MRLINADKVIAIFKNIAEHLSENENHGQAVTLFYAADVINVQPTIDAVEVVHGRWKKANNRPKSYIRVCTVCGKEAYFCGEGCSYKFCPNCGAKMDGDGKDNG